MTLAATTTIATALAASSTEYASNDYVFLMDDIETKELSGSYSKVTFEADKDAVGNNYIIFMVVSSQPFKGSNY